MLKKVLVMVCTVALLASLLSGLAVFAEETNLIKNPNFSNVEEKVGSVQPTYLWPTDWTKTGGSLEVNYQASTEKIRGTSGYSLKIHNTNATSGYMRAAQEITGLEPNTYYNLSGWYYTDNETEVSLSIRETLDTGVFYSIPTSTTVSVKTILVGKWNKVNTLIYIPTGVTSGYLNFQVKFGGAIVYIDDLSLVKTKNLLANGDCDSVIGVSGSNGYTQFWERMSSSTATMGTNALVEEIKDGNYALKLINTPNSAVPRIIHKNIPLSPNKAYRISFDFKSSLENNTSVWWKIVYMQWDPTASSGAGAYVEKGGYFGKDISVSAPNQWEGKTDSFITIPETETAHLYLNVSSTASNITALFDNIVIEEDYTSVGLYNSIGNKITTAGAGETVTAKGHFFSTSSEVTDGLMVVGLYEVSGSTLKLVNIQSVPATELASTPKDVEVSVTIPSESSGVKYCVKAFAWDGFSSMKPYADVATLTQAD